MNSYILCFMMGTADPGFTRATRVARIHCFIFPARDARRARFCEALSLSHAVAVTGADAFATTYCCRHRHRSECERLRYHAMLPPPERTLTLPRIAAATGANAVATTHCCRHWSERLRYHAMLPPPEERLRYHAMLPPPERTLSLPRITAATGVHAVATTQHR